MNRKKWISAFVCLSMMASMYPVAGAADTTADTTTPAAEESGNTYTTATQAAPTEDEVKYYDNLGYYQIKNFTAVDEQNNTLSGCKFTFNSENELSPRSDTVYYYKNTTVTATVKKDGYKVTDLTVTAADDTKVTAKKVDDTSWSFTMPTQAVKSVQATLAVASQKEQNAAAVENMNTALGKLDWAYTEADATEDVIKAWADKKVQATVENSGVTAVVTSVRITKEATATEDGSFTLIVELSKGEGDDKVTDTFEKTGVIKATAMTPDEKAVNDAKIALSDSEESWVYTASNYVTADDIANWAAETAKGILTAANITNVTVTATANIDDLDETGIYEVTLTLTCGTATDVFITYGTVAVAAKVEVEPTVTGGNAAATVDADLLNQVSAGSTGGFVEIEATTSDTSVTSTSITLTAAALEVLTAQNSDADKTDKVANVYVNTNVGSVQVNADVLRAVANQAAKGGSVTLNVVSESGKDLKPTIPVAKNSEVYDINFTSGNQELTVSENDDYEIWLDLAFGGFETSTETIGWVSGKTNGALHQMGDELKSNTFFYDNKTGTASIYVNHLTTFYKTASYEIAKEAKHGTVDVYDSAAEGEEVTFTVTPDKGYTVSSVTVKDEAGKTVEVTEGKGNTYTFTMPAKDVTISASFSGRTSGGSGGGGGSSTSKKNNTASSGTTTPETTTPSTSTGRFTDVSSSAYYAGAVEWAVNKGITNGTTANTFNPGGSCTRAQIVTFLWRAAGSPEPKSTTNSFKDVSGSAYYAKAVQWAIEQGITSGKSATSFDPSGVCTRAQAVTFLYRAAGSPSTSGSTAFGDVSSNAYYAKAVQWAVNKGITNGTSASAFTPGNNCTRGQIVTFLYRSQQ